MSKSIKRILRITVVFVLCTMLFPCISYANGEYIYLSNDTAGNYTAGDSTYYLRVFYDYGTSFPGDDASTIATAGRPPCNARKVTAKISDNGATASDSKASASIIGSGIQNIQVHPILTGHDQGTGYAKAYVYNGYYTSTNPVGNLSPSHFLDLTFN